MQKNKRLNFTKNDISTYIGFKTGLPKYYVGKIVNDLIIYLRILSKKGKLNIKNFGTINILNKTERVGRNPKTGQEAPIPPRRVLTFRPSHLMKDRVSEGK